MRVFTDAYLIRLIGEGVSTFYYIPAGYCQLLLT
jgi:hypothetical protein